MQQPNNQDMPKSLIDRFKAQAQTPEAACWTCARCGIVEPRKVVMSGIVRYRREQCACERSGEDRKRYEEQQRVWRESAARHTFNWLGDGNADTALLAKTFANFDALRQPEAYEATKAFLKALSGTLILHGTFGTGKTHLLAALCNAARERNIGSRFTTSPKLFAYIREQIGSSQSYAHIIKQASTERLLVLDDIDKAKPSDWREEVYFAIIDERTKNGLPIAISTNRLADIASFVGGACASRLRIGQIEIEMSGEDYRGKL